MSIRDSNIMLQDFCKVSEIQTIVVFVQQTQGSTSISRTASLHWWVQTERPASSATASTSSCFWRSSAARCRRSLILDCHRLRCSSCDRRDVRASIWYDRRLSSWDSSLSSCTHFHICDDVLRFSAYKLILPNARVDVDDVVVHVQRGRGFCSVLYRHRGMSCHFCFLSSSLIVVQLDGQQCGRKKFGWCCDFEQN